MRENKVSADMHSITELTMIIPVKAGMINAVGTMTYATRLRLLLKLLGGLRKNAQDVHRIKPYSDPVERIQFIHSFRLNLLGDSKLLLAVNFDGPWEPYIRSIWKDLGPLLDVIMCNCVDYPISVARPFADYDRWIRKYQVPANFFYVHSGVTVSDVSYLRRAEQIQRETSNLALGDAQLTELRVPNPVKEAADIAAENPKELVRQGLQALEAFDGLRPWYNYVEDQPDRVSEDALLLRAAQMILKEWKDAGVRDVLAGLRDQEPQGDWDQIESRYDGLLGWFEQNPGALALPVGTAQANVPQVDKSNVQGGILVPYENVKTGCLLLLQVTDASQALEYLAQLPITHAEVDSEFFVNVAFTWHGLDVLGLRADQQCLFPEEFRVGMEPRARLLGDVYENHPTHWVLPERNGPHNDEVPEGRREIQLSMVDVVIQLRSTLEVDPAIAHDILANDQHPLFQKVLDFAEVQGLELLHVQPLVRRDLGVFGFKDGLSQPRLEQQDFNHWSDTVAAGEVLLGYPTDRDKHCPPGTVAIDSLLQDGSFLVIRKIQQNGKALDTFLATQEAAGTTREKLLAKMMGREPGAGAAPLVAQPPAEGSNDFNFSADTDGGLCPYHSHIRRANPRTTGRPVPRIFRRGLSYGPLCAAADASEEQGLLFMAYNSSIANQFEVIQRWISGGNSSDGYSGQGDPFLGVPQAGEKRTFRCMMNGSVKRFDIGTPEEPRMFTRLRWGLYLFVPSIEAIKNRLFITRQQVEGATAVTVSRSADELTWGKLAEYQDKLMAIGRMLMEGKITEVGCGRKVIELIHSIQSDEATQRRLWKQVLEDRTSKVIGLTSAVWTYIREPDKDDKHFTNPGVLITAFGVLVGKYDLMLDVLRNDTVFSVDGIAQGAEDSYRKRMKASIGEIYLGLDSGDQYSSESTQANNILGSVTEADAYDEAFRFTQQSVNQVKSPALVPSSVNLFWVVDQVLASLCEHWFGIPDKAVIQFGGQPSALAANSLHCPYHYTAPSRYFFLPNPDAYTEKAGQGVGKALTAATEALVNAYREKKLSPVAGKLVEPLFKEITDNNLLARTLVGIMMGFLPTVLGNILGIFHHWLDTRSLWRIQAEYLERKAAGDMPGAQQCLRQALVGAMQFDPAPEMIWRVTKGAGTIGATSVEGNQKIVLSVTSAAHELQEKGEMDVFPAFGGNREDKEDKPPVHACPAYQMAMGVLLGLAAGVLEAGTLRPTQLPLVLELG